MYIGDFIAGSLVRRKFNEAAFSDGSPITLAGTPTAAVYKDDSTTESTAGVTLTVDFDTRTGMTHVVVDTSADGTFYAAGHDFQVVLTAGTVGGTSVVGRVVMEFSLENRCQKADVRKLLGTAWLTPGVAGTPDVNAKLIGGTAQTGLDIAANWTAARAAHLDTIYGKLPANNIADSADIATILAGVNVTQVDGAALGTHLAGYFPSDVRKHTGVQWDLFLETSPTRAVPHAYLRKVEAGVLASASFAAGATVPRVTLVDTTTTNTDMLTAAGVRTAVGLAGANLDTQLGNIKTDTGNLVVRITSTLFSGITYLSRWLGAAMGKTPDTATRAEINATTAGAGYNETTDSGEAIRDRGDTAWTTGGGGGTAPTAGENAAAVDALLSTNHGAGSWGPGSLGGGARTVTLTVTDGSSPLQNARVRVISGAQNYVGTTDASGVVVFNLDDATWAVAISLAGYSFAGATLVVGSTTTHTYVMTPVTVTPSIPGQTTGYLTVYDENGDQEAGVDVGIQVMLSNKSIPGFAYDTAVRTATSDVNGYAEFTNLFKGVTYALFRGGGKKKLVPIPASAGGTYELPSITGSE